MIRVAMVSMNGGTGRTTIAANLGGALAQGGGSRVLVAGLDPRDQLPLHFGGGFDEGEGLAAQLLDGPVLGRARSRPTLRANAARPRRQERLQLLPFGPLDEAGASRLERRMAVEPRLLPDALSRAAGDRDICLIDVAAGPTSLLRHALECADLALVVQGADPASLAAQPALELLLRAVKRGGALRLGAFVLLNRVDESRRLGRDLRAALAERLRGRLLPFAIHLDEAVVEALAEQRLFVEVAPASQAAADVRRLAEWISGLRAAAVSGPREALALGPPEHADAPGCR